MRMAGILRTVTYVTFPNREPDIVDAQNILAEYENEGY